MKPKTPYQSEIEAIEIGRLIHQKLSGGTLTAGQAEQLRQWLDLHDPDNTIFDHFSDPGHQEADILEVLSGYGTGSSLNRIIRKIRSKRGQRTRRLVVTIGVAATLLIGFGLLLRLGVGDQNRHTEIDGLADISPGGNRAVLILPSGEQLDLDEENESVILSGSTITYGDGTPVLQGIDFLSSEGGSAEERYASLVTPKGGQYQITLPDGSKVWLNAASSLRYPINFDDGTRVVELEGEAYFEVTHTESNSGEATPFRVMTEGQLIEVLGTSFNVSAYAEDRQTVTSLLEGKVRVRDEITGSRFELEPGEQSRLGADGSFIKQQADVAQSVAWKEGFFQFKRADIQTVMRQIGRWYDVDVRYEGIPEDISITGKAYRNVNASQALEILQHLDIPFRIEKNEIVITKR